MIESFFCWCSNFYASAPTVSILFSRKLHFLLFFYSYWGDSLIYMLGSIRYRHIVKEMYHSWIYYIELIGRQIHIYYNYFAFRSLKIRKDHIKKIIAPVEGKEKFWLLKLILAFKVIAFDIIILSTAQPPGRS